MDFHFPNARTLRISPKCMFQYFCYCCTVLPKVFPPLPLHTIKWKWHPIITGFKTKSAPSLLSSVHGWMQSVKCGSHGNHQTQTGSSTFRWGAVIRPSREHVCRSGSVCSSSCVVMQTHSNLWLIWRPHADRGDPAGYMCEQLTLSCGFPSISWDIIVEHCVTGPHCFRMEFFYDCQRVLPLHFLISATLKNLYVSGAASIAEAGGIS